MHNPDSFHQRGIFGTFHFTVGLRSFRCCLIPFQSQNSWNKSDLKWGPSLDIKHNSYLLSCCGCWNIKFIKIHSFIFCKWFILVKVVEDMDPGWDATLIQLPIQTSGPFCLANTPGKKWEETREPVENSQGHWENVQNSTQTVPWAQVRTQKLWNNKATCWTIIIQALCRNVAKCINCVDLRSAWVFLWIGTNYSLYPAHFPFFHSPLATPAFSLRSELHLLSLRNFCGD